MQETFDLNVVLHEQAARIADHGRHKDVLGHIHERDMLFEFLVRAVSLLTRLKPWMHTLRMVRLVVVVLQSCARTIFRAKLARFLSLHPVTAGLPDTPIVCCLGRAGFVVTFIPRQWNMLGYS